MPDQRVGKRERIARRAYRQLARRAEGASCETPSSEMVNETSIDCGHHLGHVGPRRWKGWRQSDSEASWLSGVESGA